MTKRRTGLSDSFRKLTRHPELGPLFLLCFLLGLTYSFLLPFLSLFGTEEVGMSKVEFGLFMTVSSLGSIGFSTVLARLSDTRVSRKRILLLGSLAGTLGYGSYATVRDPLVLTLIGAFVLAVAGSVYPQVFALARDILRKDNELEKDAPLYMNVVRLCFALAWTVGPALSALLMARTSFFYVFLAAAGLYASFGILVYFWVSEGPRLSPQGPQTPLKSNLRTPSLFLYFLAFCIYFACSTMGMMNLPLLITKTLGAGEAVVGVAYSLAPVFEIPLMLGVGFLALRFSVAHIIRLTLLVAAAYYFVLSSVTSPYQIYAAQILSALVVSVMGGLAITFFQDFLPDQAGTATNLYSNASRVGGTAGYLGFGLLSEGFGHRGVFSFAAAACLFTFVLVFFAGVLRKREASSLVAQGQRF